MTLDECITILTEHNKWRRGVGKYEKRGVSIHRLGEAIDFAIEELHRLKGLEK